MSFSCNTCNGSGKMKCTNCSGSVTVYDKCVACYGNGGRYHNTNVPLNYGTIFEKCYQCNGTGKSYCVMLEMWWN